VISKGMQMATCAWITPEPRPTFWMIWMMSMPFHGISPFSSSHITIAKLRKLTGHGADAETPIEQTAPPSPQGNARAPLDSHL
jgi:hypothetical protein